MYVCMYVFMTEGKGGRKTSMCGCLLHTPTWGPGAQPRHVPWLESNQWPFGSQAGTQSTEPHQPGHDFSLSFACIWSARTVCSGNASWIKTLLFAFSFFHAYLGFYHYFRSCLISLYASSLHLLSSSLSPLMNIMSRVVMQLSGHPPNFVHSPLPTGLNQQHLKTLHNLESIYLASFSKAATLHNSEGTICVIEYIFGLYLQEGVTIQNSEWCSLELCNTDAVILFFPVPILQTPFSEKAPQALHLFTIFASKSCPLINIPSLEAFPGFPNPFPLSWYHCNYIG